jgi:hypothetical protein
MKDNIAFAAVVITILVAMTYTWAINLFDPTEGHAIGLLIAKSFATPKLEVRRLEPVTVVGYRDRTIQRSDKAEAASATAQQPIPQPTPTDASAR